MRSFTLEVVCFAYELLADTAGYHENPEMSGCESNSEIYRPTRQNLDCQCICKICRRDRVIYILNEKMSEDSQNH